jgi:dipeptidyl-peptidase-4
LCQAFRAIALSSWHKGSGLARSARYNTLYMQLLLLLLAAAALVCAQKKPVTLELAAEYRVPTPQVIWAPDGWRLLVQKEKQLGLYTIAGGAQEPLIDLATLESQAVTAPAADPVPFHWTNRGVKEQPVQWAPDGTFLLLAVKGDLFRFDLKTRETTQLTKTTGAEQDPRISPDGRKVSFHREHDLWVLDLASRKETRLSTGGTSTRMNGGLDWAYPEELGLSTAHWWSPDSSRIAYLQFDTSGVMLYPHADLTILRPLAEPQRFPQAGTANSTVRLGVVSAGGGRTRWLDTAGPDDRLLARVTWRAGSRAVVAHRLNRIQNQLEAVEFDLATGQGHTLVSESDPAWVNLKDDFRFLSKTEQLVWGSERDGFRHLYLVSLRSRMATVAITRGDWEVTDLHCVDEETGAIYFTATAESPIERHLYRANLRGGSEPERLTKEPGTHAINMAPGCRHYTDTWSSLTEPPQTVVASSAGGRIGVVEAQDRKVLDEYEVLPTELCEFRGQDGALYYARLLRPAGFDPSEKYPAVVQVYGGPHAQNVRNLWRGPDWDQALAHRGFVVWQMDNRGTAYRGHAWETPLHRRFGKQELADQIEGVEHLVSLGFVDPERIGVNGWSYGGFMTLYSMLNSPDTFRAGIAGAPVTDWRNYDTIYTERYLGLPAENEDGYRLSSPLHQAANLKGRVLLVHNFEDDNVLFQHTLRMADEFQKENKPFEMMIYPQKTHGVTGKVRQHLLRAFTDFLERTLR